MEKHITPMTELKQRWASMRAAFADHVYEASETNLPVPVLAEPEKSPYNPAGTRGEGEARESTTTVRVGFPTSETWDSRGGQIFTDEQAIALLSMGLNDLSGGVESRHAGVESTGELVASEKDHCQVPSGSSDPPAQSLILSGDDDRRRETTILSPVTGIDRESSPAQIITSPNGIFAGTVIGVKASATKDGITHVAFGPDAKTAVNRLLKSLHQYD